MGRFSNRNSNTSHNILKANCQLFSLTQFGRLFMSYHDICLYLYWCRYILSCDLKSFSTFFGSLLLKQCGCFSCTFHFFKPVFVISWSSLWQTNFVPWAVRPVSFAVAVNFRTSHRFQSFFARLAFTFYYILLLFIYSAYSLSIVIQWSIVFKLTYFLPPKILYFFPKKKKLKYRFRFDFPITTVGFQFK